ncbi:hypothetical protein [Streptomyces sp. NPDC001948]
MDNPSAWSDIERPEFDKALAAVLAGEVPALWYAYLDRFTRKGIDDIRPILGKARVEPIPPDLMARARQVAAGRAFATPEQAGRIGTVTQLLTDSVKCRGCRGGASPDSKNYR